MFRPRIIPCLLLKNRGLVKTIKFNDPTYVGDPINTIKIFNEKEVDELIFLDISATVENALPQLDIVEEIASECFMPVCYGGGIRSIEAIREIFNIGIEKVAISSFAVENPLFIKEASEKFGNQSIVVCLDVRKNLFGKYEIVTHNAKKKTGIDPVSFAVKTEEMGAGELLVNSVDRDGTMSGFDIDLISKIAKSVNIPVIACGGAGKLSDIGDVVKSGGASSTAVGSMFVFQGKHRAVLISYPDSKTLESIFAQ
jgi:cyclase